MIKTSRTKVRLEKTHDRNKRIVFVFIVVTIIVFVTLIWYKVI